VGGKDWYTGVFFFPRRAHRLAEEDRLAALRRNQEKYNLLLSADHARRRRGNITSRSPDCVSLADRTCRPYGPGSEGRRRADHLARRTRAAEEAEEAEEEANRGRHREDEEPAALFRLPLLTRPLPTTPVVTQLALLRCAYHISDPDKGEPFRPAVPKLYAWANSVQTSAITSTEGTYTGFEGL
ncbi:hypothetical protein D6D12_05190, partial [Aureobasidium pullulans]